ncbi:MAG: peptidylprolyl isomerase [Caulobacteraceae bacterium]|nr:peptidylprolyl isomerase [Caulobacteraceae bacterium]
MRSVANPILALLTCAMLGAGLAACGREQAVERPPQAGDRAVAKVGEETIWASDVKREAVAEGLINEGEPLDVSSALFGQALDELIDIKVLAAEAAKRKLDQSPAAQRRLASARDRILQDLLLESVLEKAITPRSTMGLYEEQLKRFQASMQYKARQIVVATQPEADEVKKQALQKNADFAALATSRSTDAATRFDGGELGYFTTDVMPEPYGVALKDAKTGDLVGPFKTDAGFVLLKVEDARPEPPIDLEAAKPQIIKFQTFAVVKDVIDGLRKDAKIKILLDQPKPGVQREPDSAPPAPGADSRLRPAPVPAP